jgi:hypothetical protein
VSGTLSIIFSEVVFDISGVQFLELKYLGFSDVLNTNMQYCR